MMSRVQRTVVNVVNDQIASKAVLNRVTKSETLKTVLNVQYLSKNISKTLSGIYQVIGKVLANCVPSQILMP